MKKQKKVQTQRFIGSTKIIGREEWQNTETGEVIESVTTLQQVQDINFTKVWITHLLYGLEVVGGSKMKVVNYILDNLNYTENILIATYPEIASDTGVSERTVGETIRLLREANFLKTRPGIIMLNPDVLAKGSPGKRQALLIKFETFSNNPNNQDKQGDANDK